jgi:hypothetical protein
MAKVKLIEKEDIPKYKFISHEVLEDEDMRKRRDQDLSKGMTLGNTHHNKIRVHFATTEGVMAVETTVWAATPENVSLKGGVFIPVHCILQVDIY